MAYEGGRGGYPLGPDLKSVSCHISLLGCNRTLCLSQNARCAASLGFFLNFTTYAVIQLTGSMTQKILATLKGCAMVGISVLFMGDAVSLRQLLGYMISIMGFSWYRYLNHTVHIKDKQE